MNFRVIALSNEDQSVGLDMYEWFTGATNEHTMDPTEIEVNDNDKLVIIWAQDNFDKAIELGRKFYQAGVLTLGVFPEYIEEQECFDSQTINDGKSILSIVRAITAPVIYSGPISFDFNDIHTALKDAERFYARFIYGADVDSLISKVEDKFQQIGLSNVESACINLYGELQPDFNSYSIDKIKALLSMMPEESTTLLGVHKLPDSFTGIEDKMEHKMSLGISFILAGEDMRIWNFSYR
uniref:Uncharacterized protein n=1 Tax=uncultured Muribaculaceae bacterium TaxID=2301481 RepID=A0A6G8F479_9BACT|nr:hypothetical protein Muribac1_0200 [uncultured Muribaculaceae bacterium]